MGFVAPGLRKNLLTLARAYIKKTGVATSSLSKQAHSDTDFFANLQQDKVSFSVRKYDEMLVWFYTHWPVGLRWPPTVDPPTEQERRNFERANKRSESWRGRNLARPRKQKEASPATTATPPSTSPDVHGS